MAFKNLEQRFNETVNDLYAAATTKFENGRASRGANDDPLIVRKPTKGYWTRAESRSTPIASAASDLKRLTLFTLSVRGIAFLAKQQLLQTGNTFESSRIINPAFILSNAIPFLHTKRSLDIPITVRGIGRQLLGGGAIAQRIFGSGGQKNDPTSLRKIGQLQQETYDKYAKSSPSISSFIKKIPVIGKTISAATAKRSMGEVGDGWKNSRPELGNNDSGYVVYGKITDWNQNKQTVASSVNNVLRNLFSLSPAVRGMDLVKYGPLKNNGKYTTYLSLGSDQKSWIRPRNVTDYTKYISKNYKQSATTVYTAYTEELSPVGRESRLETVLYKKSSSEKELDKKISEYPKTHFVVKALSSLSTIGKIRPEIGEADKDYFLTTLKRFKFGGEIFTFSFEKTNYGVKTTASPWNGTYTTYLNIGHNQKQWQAKVKLSDYKNYSERYYKQVSNQKYAAVTERLSTVGTGNLLSTKIYKKSLLEKELDKKITDYVAIDVKTSNEERDKARPMVLASGQPVFASYQGKQFLRYFSPGNVGIASANGAEIADGRTTNMQQRIEAFKTGVGKNKKLSYIKDDSNLPAVVPNLRVRSKAYQNINNHFDDPIVVSFAMGNSGHVRFRSYIKELQESVNPQYTPYQYIGRIEKFINYTGVQREISFKLAILAFSKDELEGVWTKINYLTGMAFPYGFTKGILQPNIIRLTIGNVYVDQPGYISSLNKNFNEPAETWEIDQNTQVPIGATMDMRFVLIEKATKIAESPFHGITENTNGFATKIETPAPVPEVPTINNNNPPTVSPLTERVENRSPVIDPSRLTASNKIILGTFVPPEINIPQPTIGLQQPPINFSSGLFRGFGGGGGFSGGGGGISFP